MAIHRSVTGWEKYSNGRRVVRHGGKFAKAVVNCDICPNCNQVLPRKTEPQYEDGFIVPGSMTPRAKQTCHGCGWDMRPKPTAHAMNELMAMIF